MFNQNMALNIQQYLVFFPNSTLNIALAYHLAFVSFQ